MPKPTSLSREPIVASLTVRERLAEFAKSKKAVVMIWCVLWVPVSLLFPRHAHLPWGAEAAPVMGPLMLPTTGLSGFAFKYQYAPALVFWGVLFGLLWTRRRLLRRKSV